MQILDTNVILRFLVGDDPLLWEKAKDIFKEAEEGKRSLLIKPLVIAEVCFVLESFYKKERNEIASSMEILLSQKWLNVEDRKPLLNMWLWYRRKFHFVDSYLIALSRTNDFELLTFDKKLEKKSS